MFYNFLKLLLIVIFSGIIHLSGAQSPNHQLETSEQYTTDGSGAHKDPIAKRLLLENYDSSALVIDDENHVHEITFFLMPTMLPLDWSSPSNLYKSMLQIYMKTLGLKDNYLIGHISMRLISPLLKDTLYIAQTSKRWQ